METNKIKAVIQFLKGIVSYPTASEFQNTIHEKLVGFGARQIGSGQYSTVYDVYGLCLKVSYKESFDKLTHLKENPIFKRFAPKVYWIHKRGFALLCKLVQYLKIDLDTQIKMRQRFTKFIKKHDLRIWDLHIDNFVKVGKKWQVIDYGCWID